MKQALRLLYSIVILSGAAFAWPACNGNWIQVPNGSGTGFYTTGDHLTFQCQPKTTPPPTQTPTSSNSTSNSNSIASSIASASSQATASLNASQSQKQSQAQTQTAQGGSATTGDQANSQSTTYVNNQVRQAPMAYAPEAFSTAGCRVGGSAGVSAPIGGISLGGSKKDKDCERVSIANGFFSRGNYKAGCKLLMHVKTVAEALTLDECVLAVIPKPVEFTAVTPAPPTPITVIVQAPPPVLVTEPQVVNVVAPKPKAKVVHKRKPTACPTAPKEK